MTFTATTVLSTAEQFKFGLLSDGVFVTDAARIYVAERMGDRPMTPADYASTSGIILVLEDDVWVNAPIAEYNPNFVAASDFVLDTADDHLVVRGRGFELAARLCPPPSYHGTSNSSGEAFNSYGFTHGDRVRVSPVEGCSMTCKFCDLPYEFRYRTKRIAGLVETVQVALDDPAQPASHVLLSGGTPRQSDIGYVRDCYEAILRGFPDVAVDVMMVPVADVIDPVWLHSLGVNELSVNIEIHNRDIARKLMRKKFDQGLDHYLTYLEDAATVLGHGRVRSMLMVGLEPIDDTLEGVRVIAERGCVPVLSPFRPDPSTPLTSWPPPSESQMIETYLRAREITESFGVPLGPSCIACSHNTLTLAGSGSGDAHRFYGDVNLI